MPSNFSARDLELLRSNASPPPAYKKRETEPPSFEDIGSMSLDSPPKDKKRIWEKIREYEIGRGSPQKVKFILIAGIPLLLVIAFIIFTIILAKHVST
ncbi:hypothetical protein NEOLI_003554 [Neolecta irregularis DAH-3]|uniref:Uncharacterized protein n=1 Tax=Neolecta irregularis (strain DAH-3) TaxID=1198029 RepID=A0A1U7LR28_NEOID|nr:hypothetical protein NEOLI_003554 [Neolecta irregularis DAH-3]|eukprot:OLL25126.1 hypothetical protein NEOLI_003554 [Neolecta irregularis DAH-3]